MFAGDPDCFGALVAHPVPEPRPTPATRDVVDLAFRVATSLIFVVAGLGHLARPDSIVAQLDGAPLATSVTAIAEARFLVLASGPPLVLGGLALLVGKHTRAAAGALLLVLVPITVVTHVGSADSVGPLFKNVALMGALLHFAAYGAGRFSADGAGARAA